MLAWGYPEQQFPEALVAINRWVLKAADWFIEWNEALAHTQTRAHTHNLDISDEETFEQAGLKSFFRHQHNREVI